MRFDIYRNDKARLLTGFSFDYEGFKNKTGVYPTNGLLVVLLGEENPLSKKIMKAENFILNKNEKELLANVLEKYIEPKIKGFRNGNPLEDPCSKVIYKGMFYYANAKGVTYKTERNLLRIMSLYNCFYDPEDKNIVEIKYHHSIE